MDADLMMCSRLLLCIYVFFSLRAWMWGVYGEAQVHCKLAWEALGKPSVVRACKGDKQVSLLSHKKRKRNKERHAMEDLHRPRRKKSRFHGAAVFSRIKVPQWMRAWAYCVSNVSAHTHIHTILIIQKKEKKAMISVLFFYMSIFSRL